MLRLWQGALGVEPNPGTECLANTPGHEIRAAAAP